MSDQVRKLAVASSVPPFEHEFVPTGHFECSLDPTFQVQFGEVEYGSPNYTMHGGVKIKDWLFCLEEAHFQRGFFLCAFLGREHFTFGRVVADEFREAQRNFVSTCMLDFCQLLCADELRAISEKSDEESFTWKKVVMDK